MSLATHLAALDPARMTQLLEQRPDVLVEPVPRTFEELAQRLNGVDSLSEALQRINRDELAVARVVAVLGEMEPATLAERLCVPEADVRDVVGVLCARGLAWEVRGRFGLPPRLAEHLGADFGPLRPLAVIARNSYVEHLRTAVAGLGSDPEGLRKPELIARLETLLTDPETVARAVRDRSPAALQHLARLVSGEVVYSGFGRQDDPTTELVRAGLLLDGSSHQPALPREVALLILLDGMTGITGPPSLPPADQAAADGQAGAQAGLRALTTLLDEARHRPLAPIKKGGVGARERMRLAKRLGLAEPALWIDVAAATGLLAQTREGYAPTDAYDGWREADPGVRWARSALAWFALDVAPTSRETADGEVAPPVPMVSGAGLLRRALLRAAAGGRSLRAAGEQIDWFCPLHSYDDERCSRKLAAARLEGEFLGVVTADRLTELGEHLVAVAGRPDAADELARRCADLLPAAPGLLVLQSDLTAVVSGQTSAAAARLLAAAATPESPGAATTWRFTPASVRAALDAGWTADELRAGLVAAADRPLPQPLDYLLGDVARRHGAVRVREVRTCVTGTEAEISEIVNTRSLRSLQLRRLAPTVLATAADVAEVLSMLRAAGFAPMPEDADGVVVLPERAADPAPETTAPRTRARVAAADLATRLLTDTPEPPRESPAQVELARLDAELDAAEVALLADALDHDRDVRIVYRNQAGNRTVREIRPQQLHGRWLHAWCHLRSAEREFTVAGIESVSPVG
ncbi:helicase-associated domain-containing protein [Pseudonocardia sp. MH-G8]|uniref:helicase-associated domain-containing protein n=1 Tax=Pseudonocardia sp. MH-G8 TaxID=1854588 RepID=UPI001E2D8AC7|nr:helicase-associated domain-containing protein [Pseudonocardia sp. MH-G8]